MENLTLGQAVYRQWEGRDLEIVIDESTEAIHRALEQLEVSSRELVVLRYYNGLSYDEISSVLGITKGTIAGKLTRAKRKMAKFLQRNGFLEELL